MSYHREEKHNHANMHRHVCREHCQEHEGRKEEKMEKVTVRVTRLQWTFSKKKVGFKSLPETMYRVHFTERQKDISRSRTSERE